MTIFFVYVICACPRENPLGGVRRRGADLILGTVSATKGLVAPIPGILPGRPRIVFAGVLHMPWLRHCKRAQGGIHATGTWSTRLEAMPRLGSHLHVLHFSTEP